MNRLFLKTTLACLTAVSLISCGGGGGGAGEGSEPPPNNQNIPGPETQTEAMRFLSQASFGGNLETTDELVDIGYDNWLEQQFSLPVTSHYDLTIEIATHYERNGFPPSNPNLVNPQNVWSVQRDQESAWWQHAIFAPDQLRQRVAFALSELLVVSAGEAPLNTHAEGIAAYYDILVEHSFGNYYDLIKQVSMSPAMGIYLSHQGNEKGDPETGRTPDENYARELMQLFTIGLYDLNLDGTAKRDGNNKLIPSYDQDDVGNLARVMTGWTRKLEFTNGRFGGPVNTAGGYDQSMECIDSYHDFDSKELLGEQISSGLSCEQDMDAALQIIFNHPNVAPFVSKHLIMRMVTSNPSATYIERVANVFENDGQGNRGNLEAVVAAILLDFEARDQDTTDAAEFGMVKSPVISTTQLLRAFNPIQPEGYAKVHNEIITPMRSPSVFNFYSPDHQPTDSNFQNNGLIAPEIQLFTDFGTIEHHNHLLQIVFSREVREKVNKNADNLEPEEGLFDGYSGNSGSNEVHIDVKTQLALIETALSGSVDGGFENIDDDAKRQQAINTLIEQLDVLLAQSQLSTTEKNELTNYLMLVNNNNDERRAIFIIQEAIHLILNLSHFAIQK